MIIYEIPLIVVLIIVLGVLGFTGESMELIAPKLPLAGTIIMAIAETIYLGYIIRKKAKVNTDEGIDNKKMRGTWFAIYIVNTIKAVILCVATYIFLMAVSQCFLSNKSGDLSGGIDLLLGVYIFCLLIIWCMSFMAWGKYEDYYETDDQITDTRHIPKNVLFWILMQLIASIVLLVLMILLSSHWGFL